MTRRSTSIVVLTYAAFVVGFIAWAALAAMRDHALVPTTDDSRILVGMFETPFWEWVFSLQNGHRVPITLLLFAADYRWLDGLNHGMVAGSVVTLGLAVAVLGFGLATRGGLRAPIARLVYAGAGFGLFWVASFHNLLRGICHANTAVLLFGTLALAALVRRADAGGRGWLVLCLVAATASTLSMGQGIAIWPALGVLSIALRLPWRTVARIGVAALVVGGLVGWSIAGSTAEFSTRSPSDVLLRHPLELVRFATTLVGAVGGVMLREAGLPGRSIGAQSLVWGIVGWLVFVGHLGWARRHTARTSGLDGLAIGLMAFAIAVAFGIGLTRLFAFGPDAAHAPRFLDWSGLFWVGGLLAFGSFASRARRPDSAFAGTAAVLFAATAILLAALPALRARELRRLGRSSDAALSILLGVPGPWEIHKFYRGDVSDLEPLLARLRADGKSLYADPRSGWIGQPLAEVFPLEPDTRCRGEIDLATGYPRPEWRVEGWAWDVEQARGPESIVLVDQRGRIRGLADLRHPSTWRAADRADWRGWVQFSRKRNRYTAYGVLDGGRTACPVAAIPRWEAGA